MRLGEMLYAARAPKDKCHDTSLVPDEVNAKANHANGKTKRKVYDKEMYKLQVELCRLQDWVKETGGRIIIVFEGRDAAGKGGTVKAITGEPAGLPHSCAACTFRPPKDRDVHATLHGALPGSGRDHHLWP